MSFTNSVIKLLSKYTKPIDGDPNVWLERPYNIGGDEYQEFICGSVRGIYFCSDKTFNILAVQNTKKNDNFDKVLEWFEKSCKRMNYKLAFLEVGNPRLKEKLERLGFEGNETKMIKTFQLSNQKDK